MMRTRAGLATRSIHMARELLTWPTNSREKSLYTMEWHMDGSQRGGSFQATSGSATAVVRRSRTEARCRIALLMQPACTWPTLSPSGPSR